MTIQGLQARGNITIGTVQLTTDPETYERQWPKRFSEHPGIAGSFTIQDFGRYAADMVIRLVSGRQFITLAVVEALDAAFGTQGATYSFTDWLGNEFTVFIRDWKPLVTFIDDLHTYTLELRVVSITTLFGAAYGGS